MPRCQTSVIPRCKKLTFEQRRKTRSSENELHLDRQLQGITDICVRLHVSDNILMSFKGREAITILKYFYIFSADIPGWQVWLIFATLFAVAVNLWRASLQDSSSKMHSMEATTCRCQSLVWGAALKEAHTRTVRCSVNNYGSSITTYEQPYLVWFAV